MTKEQLVQILSQMIDDGRSCEAGKTEKEVEKLLNQFLIENFEVHTRVGVW